MQLIGAGILLASAFQAVADPSLTVRTRTGVFTGLHNANFSAVREFRNIPFAQPPVGSLRFQPPEQLPSSSKHHYSTQFPPSCPQFVSSKPSFFEEVTPYLLANNGHQDHSTGLTLQTSSEDCLRLSIWTPSGISADAKLPVVFFMTGGGFKTGGVDVPAQNPSAWVNRTQEHIVVTINYRVNIFGYPNAAGLDNPNPALLDQRLALEWVHENIAAFGGNPEAITMWGQSAGAISTDYHNFAFWDNPLVQGTFSQSGTAIKTITSSDYAQSNFTFVAKNSGCDFPDNSTKELECMQQVPMTKIENFVGQYAGKPGLIFGPIADEHFIFSDYPARAAAGKLSTCPAIFSDAANNDVSLSAWPSANVTEGPYQPTINAGTLSGWVCPTANTSIIRTAANRTTYRFQYAGSWPNQDAYAWMGAFHSSDLMMFFGTYFYNAVNTTARPTIQEVKTSQIMQDHLLAFMKDPKKGPASLGWVPYTYGGKVIRFGANGIPAQNVSGYEIDGPCFGNGTYNPFP
ncbi:carboxylesterase [Penicillium argentinense]|uniref:Carboxylesterase n=1 Tax=Penicillium argentinense TaxID=1131581 RepID=A0A9W9FDB9_9EURO|nr:carboxylesterase [Penicillium argentinense]KAJ5098121.1 carboxylesterase [Penicillium argentinense]